VKIIDYLSLCIIFIKMKASEIAKIVVTYFDVKEESITNKKLQKLLYYIEAWFLVYKSSIIDEDFEAWVHGPVIPDIYKKYRDFGYSDIKNQYNKGITPSEKLHKLLNETQIEPDSQNLLFAILKQYESLSSYELEELTHSEKPWLEARGIAAPFDACTTKISKANMKNFYTSLIHA
jgi:uncharacterized phage-associated protein